MASADQETNLRSLLALFYDDAPRRCGQFEPVAPDEMADPYGNLLCHHDHMTVTMEAYHDSLVDVQVIAEEGDDDQYWRKILLTRRSDDRPVLFGIVRIGLKHFAAAVQDEIRGREMPLGRILINHNVMRYVEPLETWKVTAGEDLANQLKIRVGETAYGRTAIIHCNEEPAIELMEVVYV